MEEQSVKEWNEGISEESIENFAEANFNEEMALIWIDANKDEIRTCDSEEAIYSKKRKRQESDIEKLPQVRKKPCSPLEKSHTEKEFCSDSSCLILLLPSEILLHILNYCEIPLARFPQALNCLKLDFEDEYLSNLIKDLGRNVACLLLVCKNFFDFKKDLTKNFYANISKILNIVVQFCTENWTRADGCFPYSETMEALIRAGVDLNTTFSYKKYKGPLEYVQRCKILKNLIVLKCHWSPNVIKAVVSKFKDVLSLDNGNALLMKIIKKFDKTGYRRDRKVFALELMISQINFDLNVVNFGGDTILMQIINKFHDTDAFSKIVAALCSVGRNSINFDIGDRDGNTALMVLVALDKDLKHKDDFRQSNSVFTELVLSGASTNLKNKHGKGIYELTSSSKNKKIIKEALARLGKAL